MFLLKTALKIERNWTDGRGDTSLAPPPPPIRQWNKQTLCMKHEMFMQYPLRQEKNIFDALIQ